MGKAEQRVQLKQMDLKLVELVDQHASVLFPGALGMGEGVRKPKFYFKNTF